MSCKKKESNNYAKEIEMKSNEKLQDIFFRNAYNCIVVHVYIFFFTFGAIYEYFNKR